MSTDWGYKCKTHGVSSDGNSSSWFALESAWRAREALRKVATIAGDWVDIKIISTYGDDLSFLISHASCDLCLINEYGETKEMNI